MKWLRGGNRSGNLFNFLVFNHCNVNGQEKVSFFSEMHSPSYTHLVNTFRVSNVLTHPTRFLMKHLSFLEGDFFLLVNPDNTHLVWGNKTMWSVLCVKTHFNLKTTHAIKGHLSFSW